MDEDASQPSGLHENEHLYELLVQNNREFAMFGIDLAGKILSWNPGVEHVFGYEREEFVGRPAELIFTDEDKQKGAPERELLAAASEGEAADVRWHLRKDGKRLWANGVMTALYEPGGKLVGFAKVVRDQTEKKQLEVQKERLLSQLREEHDLVNALNALLEQRVSEGLLELSDTSEQLDQEALARRRVEESAERLASEVRSQADELESLTYAISHDLRSPLRGLDGFSAALLEDYGEILDETGQSYLRRIRAGSQLIGDLIDNLLGLSRLSRRNLRHEEIDLTSLSLEIVCSLRESHPEREVTVVVEEGLLVTGDGQMLRLLLEHLLVNAWKFTSTVQQPRVEVGREDVEERAAYFVRDNGIGFDMHYADRLFTPFQHMHSHNEQQGAGIGLATVKRIVRRHGGRVWAESEPGAGTTVYFTL